MALSEAKRLINSPADPPAKASPPMHAWADQGVQVEIHPVAAVKPPRPTAASNLDEEYMSWAEPRNQVRMRTHARTHTHHQP